MRHVFLLLLALTLTAGVARAQSDLVVYNIRGLSAAAWNGSQLNWTSPRDSKHANVTPGSIVVRKGTTVYDSNWWGYKSENMWLINWPQTFETLNMGQDYYEFTVSADNPNTHRMNLTSISVGVAREAYDNFIGGDKKGARIYRLYSSIDGYDKDNHIAQLTLPAPFSDPNNQRIDQGVLTANLGSQYDNIPTVTFRVYGYGDSNMDPNKDPEQIRGGGGIANFAGSFEHRISEIEPLVPYTVAGTGSNIIVRGTVVSGSTPPNRTVSTNKQGLGTISPTSQTVAHGSTTSFSITPSGGNAIVNATGCGGTLWRDSTSNSGIYYTAAVTQNCTVSVEFGLIREVTATASPGGQVSPTGTFNVASGTPAVFSAVANYGMLRGAVGGTCPTGSWSGDTYTTGNITSNCTAHFNFTSESHTVSASAGSNGSVTPSSRTVSHGNPAGFTVTPVSGYLHGAVGGSCPSGSFSGNTYTIPSVISSCSVEFNFTQNTHPVTSSVGPNGTVSPLGTRQVAHGATFSYTVTPAGGYEHGEVGGDCPPGASGGWSGNTYTTGGITNACDISFSFTQAKRTVTAQVSEGGTVSPSSQQVAQGGTASFTVTPPTNKHYHGGETGTCPKGSWNGNVYTTGVVDTNCSINFSFATGQRTVTATVGPNGMITPGMRQVGFGSTASFTVVPDFGFFKRPMGGNCPKGSFNGNTYTTGPITSNCTLNASFSRSRHGMSPGVILLLLGD
ncbi:hypothetical protein [Desulfonatronum sp. SC1]|uniref:hypothetical protein n=1 Tax=Desulfonatronum sp. SC1 TaxID=2109626 RepID=UPI000D2F5D43|nr:hypothetical protein [Desulfonatronum sp. SC1]PTN38084.1 hypothetical protein C6366_04265 [Desulfonatronum sp. SC1]